MERPTVELGPFHPLLEDRFTHWIAALRRRHGHEPLVVLSPSRWILRRLQELAARALGGISWNIHFWTFEQLADALYREAAPPERLVLDPLFHQKLLLDVIEREPNLSESFRTHARRSLPTAAALHAALRDLRDATMDPRVLLEALHDSLEHPGHSAAADATVFSPADQEKLFEIVLLYSAYCEALRRLGVHDSSDLLTTAARQAGSSPLLATLRGAIWYGFYDLTQAQWNLFEAVARAVPSVALLPILLDGAGRVHPNFRYAEIFYQSFLRSLAAEVHALPADTSRASRGIELSLFTDEPPPGNPSLTVTSASGERDEVWACAKKILSLAVSGRAAFHDIGVVVRSLEAYAEPIRAIFRENRIPFRTNAGEPIALSPVVKLVHLLLQLRRDDFDRRMTLEILSHPYAEASPGPEEASRWDHLTRALKIGRGIGAWRERLARALQERTPLRRRGDEPEETEDELCIPPESVRRLADRFRALSDDLCAVPARARWSEFAARYRTLLARWIRPPEGDPGRPVLDAVLKTLDGLAGLDVLGREPDEDEFAESFTEALESAALDPPENNLGVTVLDAMAARGLRFRHLFILGLNEQVFPRAILPEPFLSDDARRRIVDDLGYKVRRVFRLSQKKEGYDEERLLFTLLLQSADEEIHLFYQRADRQGRLLSPSNFLQALRMAIGDPPEERVPRSVLARYRAFRDWLTPVESFVHARGQVPERMALLRIAPEDAQATQKALDSLNRWQPPAGEFDGMVGPVERFLERRQARGYSPTALETLATCPFRFFAAKVLALEEIEDPSESTETTVIEEGVLYDTILTRLYQGLHEQGVPAAEWRTRALEGLPGVAAEVFAEHERKNFIRHPALWHAVRERILEDLATFLDRDGREIAESGQLPSYFQKRLLERLDLPLDGKRISVPVYGIPDRVDSGRGLLRIVDYKRSFHRAKYGAKMESRALSLASLQGPLYLELARRSWPDLAVRGMRFCFLRSHSEYDPAAYDSDREPLRRLFRQEVDPELGGRREEFLDRLGRLLGFALRGEFFIRPDDDEFGACGGCPYALVCRKDHRPTRVRVEGTPAARELEALRKAKS